MEENKIFIECLNCGINYLIPKSDIKSDDLGNFAECRNCGATFDVDTDNSIKNDIKKVLSKVKNEYNKFIEEVKTIDLENLYRHNLNYAFIINELVSFLNNEIETAELNFKTKLSQKEYKSLYTITNLSDSLLDMYYNSELGTSYEDLKKLLSWCAESNEIVEVGNKIRFNSLGSNDDDLNEWVKEQSKKGITEFEVTEFCISSQNFYIKDCEYAISFDDNWEKIY